MSPDDVNTMIDVLIKRAPELRAAGIASASLNDHGVIITLVEPGPPTDARGIEVASDERPADAPPPPPLDPLQDPATYPGGRIPGFQRPPKR